MTRLVYPGGDPENGPAYNPEAVDANGHKKYDEWGNRIYHRKDGKEYAGPHWRKMKRHADYFGTGLPPVFEAHDWGVNAGDAGAPYRNPYPPGRRHDAFRDGYNETDPLGDFHGRNF